jgi:malonyl CoA-acyl carrier protein transacylase
LISKKAFFLLYQKKTFESMRTTMNNQKLVWLIPGQGQQKTGFLKPWMERFREVRQRVEWGSDLLKQSLVRWSESDEQLEDTAIVQVLCATLVFGLADVLRVEHDRRPSVVLGHSLGEVIGLSLAGAWSLEEGLHLIWQRGQAMKQGEAGGLSVYLGSRLKEVLEILLHSDWKRKVYPANFNSPKQLVLSGQRDHLIEFASLIKEFKWGVVKSLKVSVPAHSPLMEKSAQLWSQFLPTPPYRLSIPCVSNTTGEWFESEFPREHLMSQLTKGVRWTDCVRTVQSHLKNPCYLELSGNLLLGRLIQDIVLSEVKIYAFEEFLKT